MNDNFKLNPAEHLFDKEISLLAFNKRVLELAEQGRMPLLERLRFLGIFSSNLDEFYMKRIGGLKRQIRAGVEQLNAFGRSPREEIDFIRGYVDPCIRQAHDIFSRQLIPALRSQGIYLRSYNELAPDKKIIADTYFKRNIFPLLTPLSVDSGHPFPIISNLSTSLGVALKQQGSDSLQFARIKLSHISPQWIPLGEEGSEQYEYLSIEEVVTAHLDVLFPGMEIVAAMPFRVTRNAGLEVVSDDDADDLLEVVEEELRQRRFAEVVRIQHGPQPDQWLKDFLIENLEVTANDVYEMPNPLLTYAAFSEVVNAPLPELRFNSWTPLIDPELSEEPSFFSRIRYNDLLVHHPYESFHSSVERFLREAVNDPQVQSIKMTVYRVGDTTPLIPLLVRAAEFGKNVVCLVEVKARFDEERNIQWAYTLEDAGVHVVYGIPGLKTHAKTLMVIREDEDGLRAYAHIGTGNYHTHTANLYTDLGLFTCRPDITSELIDFFNFLTGRSLKDNYQALLVAPVCMDSKIREQIAQEIANAKDNKPAAIYAVLNNLEDSRIINDLYLASQAGVQVRLVVRSVCCLKPGMQGVSENIEIRSVLGRFLEHSRMFYFRNAAESPLDGLFYITSADWMNRNLNRRVELAVPVYSKEIREYLWLCFETLLRPDIYCWMLQENGTYIQNKNAEKDAQQILMDHIIKKTGGNRTSPSRVQH